MVLLKFADGSKNDIPLEELQKIPFFKKLPSLTDDSQELDLSTVNENFTYNNLIKCIAFSQEKVDNSCYDLLDFLGLDFNFYSKNIIIDGGEYFNLDDAIKNKNYDLIIVSCLAYPIYFIQNYMKIAKLPLNIVKYCITRNNVNLTTGLGDISLLMCISRYGYKDIVKLLINSGADINHKCARNFTALIEASYNGHTDVVKILIEAGADINHKCDKNNWTALISAYEGKHKDTVKFLIESGAIIDDIWSDRIKEFYLKT